WQTAPHTPNPCMYGKSDASGAAEMSYPCPMPMDQPQTGDAGAPVDDGMARCYPCPPYYPGLRGEFVIVGIFGSHADAEVITIE
ncbi:MAG TPA: hypothetical protein VI818_01230, partial [Candidatus Thermoplasmatota archaeon]|nr:hypothetical protein [Candidatus Thermoplasmatota archaeon]